MCEMKNLTIAEQPDHRYHFRAVGEHGTRFGGGLRFLGDEGKAICGAEVAWDTHIPLMAWGMSDGFSKWCQKCVASRDGRLK